MKQRYMPGDEFVRRLLAGIRDFSGIKLEENFNLFKHPTYCQLQNYLKESERRRSLMLNPVRLNDSTIIGLVAPRLHLPYLVAENITITNSDLRYADLRYSKMPHAKIFNTNLESANMGGSEISNSKFIKSMLHKTGLRWIKSAEHCRFDQVQGNYADFYEANLRKAQISHSSLRRTHLRRADLEDVLISFVNMDESDVTGAKNIETCKYATTSSFKDIKATNEELAAIEIACIRDNNFELVNNTPQSVLIRK